MKNEEIGRRIQERRKALNISVVDIAAYTGLSKATIHRYENGEIQNIKLPVLETIASILNVNPLWLIGKSENMERMDGITNDLCVELTKAIEYARTTPYLTCRGRPATEIERKMVINTLQLVKDFLDKGE